MTDTDTPLTPAQGRLAVAAVWLLAAIGGALAGILAPEGQRLAYLSVSLAGCTVIAMAIQLSLRRREGFVARLIRSIVGAVVVTAVASIVIAVVEVVRLGS